jgi:hypothetical protein
MVSLPDSLPVFFRRRPAVMVVSHERSGTHFLMNALSACYGYVSNPWFNLDPQSATINFFHPPSVREYLLQFAAIPVATIIKSHHQAEFFRDELDRIGERCVIFVMQRDPVDTLISFWRFLHNWSWFEGPRLDDPLAFACAQPCGAMMRYQTRQHANMMHRWAAHVDGWLDAAAISPRVVFVRYEDLHDRYEDTVQSFASVLECEPLALLRPTRDVNVVPGGQGDPTGRGHPPDKEALRRLCRENVGETMSRLGRPPHG